MDDSIRDEREGVYEIGYLIAGVPEEKVSAETDSIRSVITLAGGKVISEEAAKKEALAYTIRKKTVSGAYDKHDVADFGWIKFEVGADKIEGVKKAVEVIPSVLRMLLITTVRENTYLGKNAPGLDAATATKKPFSSNSAKVAAAPVKKDEVAAAPASVEDMDKSIDEMVKEA